MIRLPFKSNYKSNFFELKGYKALVITTSQRTLDTLNHETGEVIKTGKATGVYASEMTEPYYVFLDAGMGVDAASIKGGEIPIEALSLKPVVRTEHDVRFLKDDDFQEKVKNSIIIDDIDFLQYDIIFMSGGWGAAYDYAQSKVLGEKISQAYAGKKILASVCHGALGFIGAVKPNGRPLVEGVRMTGVTNRQLKQLGISHTPKHPETELRNTGAQYISSRNLVSDLFANHVEVDEKHLIVTGQNQKAGVEVAENALLLLKKNIMR
jgi:putative intracellular protease/amidase